ncbi:carboxypeptidase-like regulatory domain-containing protein [Sphingobacterium sp. E70]|uniref:carboxypeptidase-like regulatory domain-containing protein n=1 Tax=Sphingobacterium sp. E70 TaxID=2853439 RepID=UPI00211BFEC5|nr:carboxypeptidase-like regulatory domain-containing protein [Sphingobacterium sp. E70]ULT23877.1 carboxypeptidase-like regulatory domain-containing protein [Sphingobacterium sp. E70]
MKKDLGKSRRRLSTLLVLMALGIPSMSWAQQKNVSGKVLDSNNKPIAGVTVLSRMRVHVWKPLPVQMVVIRS